MNEMTKTKASKVEVKRYLGFPLRLRFLLAYVLIHAMSEMFHKLPIWKENYSNELMCGSKCSSVM